ncbi:hypothetical protein C8J57DRAFT_1507092 [Mycena rebaudengoi]|nr:hypothetical protein C8J57DRAFT_1507092 [Mycena rebaudengoi]
MPLVAPRVPPPSSNSCHSAHTHPSAQVRSPPPRCPTLPSGTASTCPPVFPRPPPAHPTLLHRVPVPFFSLRLTSRHPSTSTLAPFACSADLLLIYCSGSTGYSAAYAPAAHDLTIGYTDRGTPQYIRSALREYGAEWTLNKDPSPLSRTHRHFTLVSRPCNGHHIRIWFTSTLGKRCSLLGSARATLAIPDNDEDERTDVLINEAVMPDSATQCKVRASTSRSFSPSLARAPDPAALRSRPLLQFLFLCLPLFVFYTSFRANPPASYSLHAAALAPPHALLAPLLAHLARCGVPRGPDERVPNRFAHIVMLLPDVRGV